MNFDPRTFGDNKGALEKKHDCARYHANKERRIYRVGAEELSRVAYASRPRIATSLPSVQLLWRVPQHGTCCFWIFIVKYIVQPMSAVNPIYNGIGWALMIVASEARW